ncbi:TPA: hypothetical protein ACPHTL_002399, partial [Enterobacter roggenkampii]
FQKHKYSSSQPVMEKHYLNNSSAFNLIVTDLKSPPRTIYICQLISQTLQSFHPAQDRTEFFMTLTMARAFCYRKENGTSS